MSTRRTFLIAGGGVALTGGLVAISMRPKPNEPDAALGSHRVEPRSPASPLAFAPFDERAQRILERMYDDLIPGDSGLPSASEAGVMTYVTSMARSAGFGAVRTRLVKLSRWLDREAKQRFATSYVELADEGRHQILEAATVAPRPARGFDVAGALELSLKAGLEGYLGHPRHRNAEPFTVWRELGVRMPTDPAESHT